MGQRDEPMHVWELSLMAWQPVWLLQKDQRFSLADNRALISGGADNATDSSVSGLNKPVLMVHWLYDILGRKRIHLPAVRPI